jgi:hypothetical protein
MSDLSYLQDEKWLAEREVKWEGFSEEWLNSSPEDKVQRLKSYFFSGGIKYLLTDSYDITLSYVISLTPFTETDLVIESITEFWFWVLESPDSRDYYEFITDLNERFIYHFHAIFSRKDDNLHPDICVKLFFWLYGETYQKDREITLNHNGRTVTINVNIDVDELAHELMSGIIDYLWMKDEGENICIFKSFIPYFLSIYPHMSPCCFSTTLPDESEFIGDDGKEYRRSWYIWNRWLLTTLNGFITKYEIDDGIDELVCNDEDALTQLKDGLKALQMPEEFYRLQEFVLKHKGKSLKASE